MDKNKSQILVLDKCELETVAKVLSSSCWTLPDSGDVEISISSASSSVCGSSPKVTIAQGNVRPVTQASDAGGTANIKRPDSSESLGLQRDSTHVATLTELGKNLVEAARVGDIIQVRRLMAIGAPFASDGPIGMNPLHYASQNGHYETCERLLNGGMNKDARNKVDKTPLHLAAMEGHTDIVHLLINSGANINACDMLKMTALHWACDRGHTSIARLLLQHSSQTDILNKFFKTPLHLAIENKHDDIITLLQEKDSANNEESKEDNGGKKRQVAQEKSSVFTIPGIGLADIPVVCKTEEVCTQEVLVEEVCESSDEFGVKEESLPGKRNELPHSIMDDLEDQNISVLATLAELAKSTKSSDHSVDMSNAAALELLKAQAALLPFDDSSALVTSAVAHGQTLHLTEAGRQALKLIKQEFPLFTSSTLPKEREQEEEENTASVIVGSPAAGRKDQSHPPSPIALPPPPPRPPPQSPQSTCPSPTPTSSSSLSSSSSSLILSSSLSSSLASSSALSSSLVSSSSVSSLLSSVSPSSSLSSSSSSSSSSSILPASILHGAPCLPTLLQSTYTEEEKEENQEVTQVIAVTPEQYAALTSGASGPVILQVLPSEVTEELISENDVNTTNSPGCKRQKIM